MASKDEPVDAGLAKVAIADQEIADEIRIVQTVHNHATLPSIVGGNSILILMVVSLDWGAAVLSGAIYSMIVQAILLAIVTHGFVTLRGRPRPAKVSHARIRKLQMFALIMGLVWSVTSWLMISAVSSVDAALLFCVLFALALAGALMMSSLPFGALGFFLPLTVTLVWATVWNEIGSATWLIGVGVFGITAVLGFIWEGWRRTVRNTRLRLESVAAQAERAELMETISTQLAKYMSPQLYQSIFSGAQKVEILSKRRKLTVMFSDIAAFTEITDQLESEELTALLNRYLTEMSKIALDHGGTIDKFIGDAMVVYFGDPETLGVKEDADQCVRMAMAMQARVAELQQEWLDMGLERTFELRIGINTGYCTVGNFGSEDRMDYTIIGSEVNLAARLETSADVGGILLANETHSLVSDWVDAEESAPAGQSPWP